MLTRFCALIEQPLMLPFGALRFCALILFELIGGSCFREQFGGPSGSEQVLNCVRRPGVRSLFLQFQSFYRFCRLIAYRGSIQHGGLPGESVVIEADTNLAQWRVRLYNSPLGKMTINGPPIEVATVPEMLPIRCPLPPTPTTHTRGCRAC